MPWELAKELTDAVPEGFDSSFGSLSQERLQFREDHLDRVQVGRVARQEVQFGTRGLDRFPNFRALVRAKIVDQNDVAIRERRNEHIFDISLETFAIDRAIEDEGSRDAIMAKRRHESRRLPMPVRHFGVKPLAAPAASMGGRHVGLYPCLIDEDEALGIEQLLTLLPARPLGRYVRSVLLGGAYDFF
jgi:hypothetical protein